MIKSIVGESSITFMEIEKKIFAYVCKMYMKMMRSILEDFDKKFHSGVIEAKIGIKEPISLQ